IGRPLVASTLPATDRAGVDLARREPVRCGRIVAGRRAVASAGRLVLIGPDDLVDDERSAARGAAGGEELADRDLQAGLSPRRGAHRLERRVEVAEIRRPQDELREQPGEGRRFEADGATLAVDRGAGNPTAAAGEVEDRVARLRIGLDPRSDERGRGRRRQALEEREREAWLCPDE